MSAGGPGSDEDRAPIRVLLADDQRLVRESLGILLGLLGGIELVATASDGEEALALAAEHHPQVVLMDIRMPRLDGIEATRRLRERCPDVRVISLTTYADDESVLGALRAGARGYLTKDASGEEIRAAILTVAAGDAALDPAVQHHVVAALASADSSPEAAAAAPELPDDLTPREAEVLALDRRGSDQHRDRRTPRRQPDDGQVPHQPPVREGRPARPGSGRHVRVQDGDRPAARLTSELRMG